MEIPSLTADREYKTSRVITMKLTEMIFNQDSNIASLDDEYMKKAKSKMKAEKENRLKQEAESIEELLPDSQKIAFKGAQEKGASVWLSALPLQALGYTLNKQEFRDAIRLRYSWDITEMPKHCACGQPTSVDHTLTCKVGGYVGLRHNRLRDTEALLMKEIAKDVQIEPMLLPVGNTQLAPGTTRQPQARLDISARGIHSPCDRSFFDVKVTHPGCASNQGKSLEQLYEKSEKEKKTKYNDRILQVEKASFSPLVFTTSGGMGPECEKLNKKIAQRMSTTTRRKEHYSKIMNHIRTRLRFALLKSVLVAVRGYRGTCRGEEIEISEIDFNLIPEGKCYEGHG